MTPDERRYVPPFVETVIDLGQRVCTSGMMIEIAPRLGLESMLEGAAFQEYAREGTFRRDLYYRLNTLPVIIPPLTERGMTYSS